MANSWTTLCTLAASCFGAGSEWFWSMMQFIAIALSLLFIWRQLRLQNHGNALTALSRLNQEWDSEEMLKSREQVCREYQKGNKSLMSAQGQICDFFEEVGIYVKRKVLDRELVWELYGYYVENYWLLLEGCIERFVQESRDTTYYSHFRYLKQQLSKYGTKKKVPPLTQDSETVRRFIESEIGAAPDHSHPVP